MINGISNYFSKVSKINSLPENNQVFFKGLQKDSFEAETISDLNNRPEFRDTEVVGKSYLTDKKTGEKIPVAITCDVDNENENCYRIVELSGEIDNFGLGYVKVRSSECNGVKSAYIPKMGSVYPHSKGIGTLLHQIAIERSIQLGCKGRVHFEAEYHSEPFHYKCGYRVFKTQSECQYELYPDVELITSTDANNIIEKEIEAAKKGNRMADVSDKLYTSCDMYLPLESLKIWEEKIAKNPCLQ